MGFKCIYNGTVITMDKNREVIEGGVIVIKDSEIVEIGNSDLLFKYNYDEKIDADYGIIMPGFINGHTHAAMSVFRSLGEDVPDRLRKYLFPLEDKLVDREMVSIGAKLAIAEMLLGGVTTLVDMYYFEDETATAAKELGIRAIAGETILNKPSPDSDDPYGGISYAVDFIKKWKDHELIIPALAPHATYSIDEEHLCEIKRLSDEYEVPILMHISEMSYEMEEFREKYNMTPVEYLGKIDFLSSRLIGAHLVYAEENDIEILRNNNVGIIHNVSSNAKSGRRISPVPEMLKRDLNVGLGTDGPMSGNHLDIINLLGIYTKVHKIAAQRREVCPAIEAVELGTIGCAKAIKLDHMIGSLEPGKKADIIIIDTNSPNILPIYDYYSAIVYAAHPHNVVLTMVNGKIVMKDRKLMTGDINRIMNDIKKTQNRIKTELDSRSLSSGLK